MSKLAAAGNLDKQRPVIVLEIPHPSINVVSREHYQVHKVEEWYTPMWNFLTNSRASYQPPGGKEDYQNVASLHETRQSAVQKGIFFPVFGEPADVERDSRWDLWEPEPTRCESYEMTFIGLLCEQKRKSA